jgi:hypothetical protein
MAGDWIQIRNNLDDDPRVLRLQAILGIQDIDLLIGKLRRLWKYADRHTTDGLITFATAEMIDQVTGLRDFSNALVTVGWLRFTKQGAQIPRFDEHNGSSAKSRALAARRQAAYKQRLKCGDDIPSAGALPKGEESIGEKNKSPPKPPRGGGRKRKREKESFDEKMDAAFGKPDE